MSIFTPLGTYDGLPVSWTSAPKGISAHACTSFALANSKKMGTTPMALADALCTHLSGHPCIATCFVTPPGYVNVVFTETALTDVFTFDQHQGKVGIEYVSANPTGPLHIGHAKQAVLGSVLTNVYKAKGYDTKALYYYNDCGNQIHLLVSSVIHKMICHTQHVMPPNPALYQGTYIADLAIAFTLNDSPQQIEQQVVAALKAQQFKTLDALNIHFDQLISEAQLYAHGHVAKVLDTWEHKGLLYAQKGAVFMDIDSKPVVVQKSNGTYTYFVPDVALHALKLHQFDTVINVQGTDHIYTKDKVLYGAAQLGLDSSKIHYLLHKMVHVYDASGALIKQSKKSGTALDIDTLLEHLDADALKFFLLSNSPNKELDIHLHLLQEQSTNNPVWYVKMTHAKFYTLIAGHLTPTDTLTPCPPELFALMSALVFVDATLETITQQCAAHLMYQLLMQLAVHLNTLYTCMPKLSTLTEEQKAPYAFWLPKIITLYATLMHLANIDAPTHM